VHGSPGRVIQYTVPNRVKSRVNQCVVAKRVSQCIFSSRVHQSMVSYIGGLLSAEFQEDPKHGSQESQTVHGSPSQNMVSRKVGSTRKWFQGGSDQPEHGLMEGRINQNMVLRRVGSTYQNMVSRRVNQCTTSRRVNVSIVPRRLNHSMVPRRLNQCLVLRGINHCGVR
jgi:hypothetical protein